MTIAMMAAVAPPACLKTAAAHGGITGAGDRFLVTRAVPLCGKAFGYEEAAACQHCHENGDYQLSAHHMLLERRPVSDGGASCVLPEVDMPPVRCRESASSEPPWRVSGSSFCLLYAFVFFWEGSVLAAFALF